MTNEEIVGHKSAIDRMTQLDMAHMIRFAPLGHPVFTNDVLHDYFIRTFNERGGMTPEISRALGYDDV